MPNNPSNYAKDGFVNKFCLDFEEKEEFKLDKELQKKNTINNNK